MSSAIFSSRAPRASRIAMAVTCTLWGAAAALAQSSELLVEEVIVGASKIEKPINEVTHSVTVVDEKTIEDQAFTDVTEILRQQAGIEFKQVGGPGQYNYLKLRGLDADNVLVIIDGVKINTASGGNTRNLLSQLSPDVIESVEIIRGPQATLYGANSTAGVISIKTKSGRHKNAGISAEAGSLGWRKATASLRNGAALGDGQLLYAANLSKTDSDGIHKYEFFEDESGQLKLSYEADRWAVGGNVWKIENAFGAAELDEASAVSSRAEYWSFQTPDPHNRSETGETIVSAYFDFDFTERLRQTVSVGSTETTYSRYDAPDGLLGYQLTPVTIPATATGGLSTAPASEAGTWAPIYDTSTDVRAFYEDERQQVEYELLFTGERFDLLGGVEYQKQAARQWGTSGASDTEDSQLSYLVNGDVKVFGNDLVLSLGARLDDYESWGTEITGNIGAAWQITPAINVYANYGTSFKPATMSQLFNPQYGDSTLSPESGDTAELGVRTRLLDNALSMEVSYWNTHIDNVIFFDYSVANPRYVNGRPCTFDPALTCGQYNNGAEGKTSGVEFKADYRLSSLVGLYGNYTYTDSMTRAVGDIWKRTVQIADHKANVGANFGGERLTFGANVYYTGPRLRWAGDLETDGYVRVDVSGRFSITRSLALFGRIENLLDDDYLDELGYAETGRYGIFGAEWRFF